MSYYLKPEAYKELNTQGWTAILDKEGEDTGASLFVLDSRGIVCPSICNMFGNNEEILLKRVEIDEDGDVECTLNYGGEAFFLYQYKKVDTSNYCNVWEAKR